MALPAGSAAQRAESVHPLNGLPLRGDVAAAMTDLADELLSERRGSTEVAARALERLRRRLYATQAVIWIVTPTGVTRAVHVGETAPDTAVATDEVGDGAMAIERLRRNGTIVCRFGEVSGVEELVPEGVRSFLATAATKRGAVTCVLVLGWADVVPPCAETAAGHLRLAAVLLARTLTDADPTSDQAILHEAVFGSLADRIAVVDRHGTIIAVNAEWTAFGRRMGMTSTTEVGPGASYLEVCRRAAAAGSPEAAIALKGIEAVCSGMSELFETAYRFQVLGEERWFEMKVTPLRRPEGGAVIVHADVTRRNSTDLARGMSDRLFHDLVDAMAVPIWIVAPDGSLIYANQAWADAHHGEDGRSGGEAGWLQLVHPDERDAAMVSFRSAVSRLERLDVEVRLPAADGTYRWWSLSGAPRLAIDGQLENYVVIGIDATELREARRGLSEVRTKLVAAQEAERSRIARELHDDLGQQLALLASRLEAYARSRQRSRNLMQAGLAEARKGLQDLATSVHNLSHELHPGKLKLLGLGPTLDALCRSISAESGTHVTFDSVGLSADLPEDSALCIFRVAQEALQNTIKHSGARSIEVHVVATPSELTLTVRDDGTGFDPTSSRSKGLGLLTMRERVEMMGGNLRIASSPGNGTAIHASIPVSGGAGAAG
jgi:PAS domain S-box-containing protein